jgi:hypothetical protein
MWTVFTPDDFPGTALLRERYDLEITDRDPQLLIYSVFGNDYLNYDCIRLYYSIENLVPDFNHCDYAISFQHLDFGERYLHHPFAWNYIAEALENPCCKQATDEQLLGRKFCATVVSNAVHADPTRDAIVDAVSAYKRVDSGGKHRNNVGGPVDDKLAFLSGYKFSICAENTSMPGYATEKIIHAFHARTIPVYWGDPLVDADIDPEAFVWLCPGGSMEELVGRVKQLDNDPQLYLQMLHRPWLRPDAAYHGSLERMRAFLYHIADNLRPQRCPWGYPLIQERALKRMIYRTNTSPLRRRLDKLGLTSRKTDKR